VKAALRLLAGIRLASLAAALAAVLVGASIASAQPAHAFAYLGAYWKSDQNGVGCGPNSVFILGIGSWNPCVISYAMAPTYVNHGANWYQMGVQAANAWSLYDASYRRQVVSFNQTSSLFSGNPQVQIVGADLGCCTAPVYSGQTLTYVYTSDRTSIAFAEVDINTNPNMPWASTNAPTSSTIDEQQTVEHELGHSIGLGHSVLGPNAGIVMECHTNAGEALNSLSADDVNGGMWIYAGHQGDFGSPIPPPC
jgi:hypothetical protein